MPRCVGVVWNEKNDDKDWQSVEQAHNLHCLRFDSTMLGSFRSLPILMSSASSSCSSFSRPTKRFNLNVRGQVAV